MFVPTSFLKVNTNKMQLEKKKKLKNTRKYYWPKNETPSVPFHISNDCQLKLFRVWNALRIRHQPQVIRRGATVTSKS